MARKVDIIAPHLRADQHALMVNRWLKNVGDSMVTNEPIAELIGDEMVIYVHAPEEGTLSSILVYQGMNILSGTVLATMSVISKDAIEWDNFDQVTDIIGDFAEHAKDSKQSKDANEALAQLLGIADDSRFQNLSIEQQNKFLQNIVDQQAQGSLGSAAAVTQKLLEGLALRMPANAPMAPSGPALGMNMGMGGGMMRPSAPTPPSPSGMGGGIQYPSVTPMQQQGYAPPPNQVGQPQHPPQYYVPQRNDDENK